MRDSKAEKLDVPEFSLATKRDLKKPWYSRFDYREPKKWASVNTLVLDCTGKVQIRAVAEPGFQFLPEWVNYHYRVEIQFKPPKRRDVKSIRKIFLQHERAKTKRERFLLRFSIGHPRLHERCSCSTGNTLPS